MNHFLQLINFLSTIDENSTLEISTLNNNTFNLTTVYVDKLLIGVNVTNLGNNSYLPLEVFSATLSLLYESPDNTAAKGNAYVRLGNPGLPINSIEGFVAHTVYGKQLGESVFCRIVPISSILHAAKVCTNNRGFLTLN